MAQFRQRDPRSLLAVAGLVLGSWLLAVCTRPSVEPSVGPTERRTRSEPDGIEDFDLTERSGRTVSKADLLGKPWIACFIFTRCAGACPNVSYQMYNLQEWLKESKLNVRLVTISVDPQYDTPAVLERYAQTFGADAKRWWFLTGNREKVYRLIRGSFGERVEENTGAKRTPGFEIFHTTAMMLVDEKCRVVGEYNGAYDTSVAKLQARLKAWGQTGSFSRTTASTEKDPATTPSGAAERKP